MENEFFDGPELELGPGVLKKVDIYGVSNEEGRWYVKFFMEHGQVTVMSCHLPEEDMILPTGVIIKGRK